jgi:Ferredoxin-like domain in Api92-like protein
MIREMSDDREKWIALDFNAAIPMPAICQEVEENAISENVLGLLAGGSGVVPAWTQLQHFDRGDNMGPWKGLAFYERGEIRERLERAFPGCIAKAQTMARCIGETGYKSWYDWSIANWGTKWNSYSFAIESENPLIVRFDTAWSFPTPVFQKIAEMFPALKFECVCFDEGWNFAGEGCFNGAPQFTTAKELATDALYERVYGCKPERDEED